MESSKKIVWYNLAFMAFSTVWGFGNVLNGFVYFNGIQVIFSWILMFALYFVPYALMVGELGSAFKDSGGGVSSWINETIGPKFAYYAGWTYCLCTAGYAGSLPVLLLGRKPRFKSAEEAGDDCRKQYVHHVHTVHSYDVCRTAHQSKRRLCHSGFQLGQYLPAV